MKDAADKEATCRILAIAAYDSFLRAAGRIADQFAVAGAEVEFGLLRSRADQITERQVVEEALQFPMREFDTETLFSDEFLQGFDVVLLALEGNSTRDFFLRLSLLGANRPLVVSFYPGIVLRFPFDGLASRSPADVLWLNSKVDLDNYCSMCEAFGLDPSNASVFGLPQLLAPIARHRSDGPIVFFEQTVIPRPKEDRQFLARKLVALARKFPGRNFAIKPRHRPNEFTLHRTRAHIEPLLEETAIISGGMPKNLAIVYDKTVELLATASHCLTISSTAAIEAIHAGVPTTIISDFGPHDDSGVQFFFGSGLLRDFDSFDPTEPMIADANWADRNFKDPTVTVCQSINKVMELARRKRSYGCRPVTVTPHYFSADRYQDLVERHPIKNIASRSYQVDRPRLSLKRLIRRWNLYRNKVK